MIQYFTIYGERCSGTNFLMNAILTNFEIEFSNIKYSWKHFFGHYDFQGENKDEEDKTLFIGIIREPISWIDSFYKKMHHIPIENRKSHHLFLFNPFYSVYDNPYREDEIMEDRNLITKDRYKNIFELRKIKNNYLINDMPKKVKNYLLIRYEDIRDRYDTVLEYFHIKFKLIKKNEMYLRINNYKGIMNYLFEIQKISLPRNIIKVIKKNLDYEQEKSLGYL